MGFLPPSNAHASGVLLLTVLALVLFTREKIPLESFSLLVLVVLAAGFEPFPFRKDGSVLHPVDFFHGFGDEALAVVCALMIAGPGIVRRGAFETIVRALARSFMTSPSISFLLTLQVGASHSALTIRMKVRTTGKEIITWSLRPVVHQEGGDCPGFLFSDIIGEMKRLPRYRQDPHPLGEALKRGCHDGKNKGPHRR